MLIWHKLSQFFELLYLGHPSILVLAFLRPYRPIGALMEVFHLVNLGEASGPLPPLF